METEEKRPQTTWALRAGARSLPLTREWEHGPGPAFLDEGINGEWVEIAAVFGRSVALADSCSVSHAPGAMLRTDDELRTRDNADL